LRGKRVPDVEIWLADEDDPQIAIDREVLTIPK